MTTYDICPKHNYQMSGIGTLLFCRKCEEGVPPVILADDKLYFYMAPNIGKEEGEAHLTKGHIIYDSVERIENRLGVRGIRSLLNRNWRIYSCPRQALHGRFKQSFSEIGELNCDLIGVPAKRVMYIS